MIRGDRVRERRILLNLTQEELAAKARTDQKRISKYEKGQSDATGDTLAGLAQALETSTDWLLGLTDDPTPKFQSNELSPIEQKVIAAMRRGDRMAAVAIISSGH